MTARKLQTFNADRAEDPVADEARLGAQLDQEKAAWLDIRNQNEPAAVDAARDRLDQAMNELRTARKFWREVGIANGTRTDGLGVAVEDNTD
jgi:hypothetical protein